MKRHLGTTLVLVVAAMFLCLGLSTPAFAQEETAATVTGQVTDSTGGVIQNATVTITNKETNAERRVQTNDDGTYVVTPLTPGTYTVSVEQASFKHYVQTITLNAKDRRPVNVVLEPGSPSEVVNVTDESPLIQESATGQALISGAQVRELPLNNRDFLKLAELVPGVSSDLADETALGLSNRTSISINGMRRNGVNFLVDGVNNTDGGSNITLLSTPTIDSIKEFKVLTSNYTAEVGRSGSGTVTVVTRSGSNDFHGSIYEFIRNDYFNANSFFNNRRGRGADGKPLAPVPKLRYNTFGATFSGPVTLPRFGQGDRATYKAKDKTFFFFSEDVRRIRRAITASTALVPTLAQRGGDFSASLGLPIFRTSAATPASCTTPGVGTCTTNPLLVTNTNGASVQAQVGMVFRADGRAYTGNIIPNADQSPIAQALLQIWPLPNSGGNTFTFSPVNLQNTRQEVVRIDHNFSDNHRIFGRYTHDLNVTQETGGLFQGINLPNIATTDTRIPGQLMAINYTAIISPNLVNEASYNFSQNFIGSQLSGKGRRSDYPGGSTPEVFPENKNNAIPSLSITGITSAGSLQGFTIRYRNQTLRDVITWTRRNHTFKFGGEWAFEGKNENSNNLTQGSFAFTTQESRGVSTNGGVTLTQTGVALGSFLLGRANTYSESEFDITFKLHLGRRELFAQDSWRIRPNLTLDYGVRYQYFVPATDRNNVIAAFEPQLYVRANAPTCADALCGSLVRGTGNELNGLAIASRNSPFGKTIVPSDKNNFSPRVGLSWSPNFKSGLGHSLFGENGKSVIRMGYGLYYDQIATFLYEDPTASNPPFSNSASFSGAGITLATPAGGALGALPIRALGGVDPNIVTPVIQQWSFGLQREIFKNAVIDVSYVGTRGDHLLDRRNINFVGPADVNAFALANAGSTQVNSIRPFRGYGAITFIETQAISRYHGFLSSLNWRFAKGSSLGLSYTFSKNLTNFTNDRDGVDAPQNQFDLISEYAEARTSRPHIFSASYIYELPFFRSNTNAFAHTVLGGWQISGITNIESGPPVSRVLASSTNGGRNGNRAQLVGDPTGGLTGTIDPVSGLPFLYDPTAFANPTLGTFGNSGRAIFRLPGRNQTNLSLVKNVYFNEEKGRYLQLRLESFNVFNHTQFFLESANGNVLGSTACVPGGLAVCTSTTGRPGSTRLPREFQFGAKLYF